MVVLDPGQVPDQPSDGVGVGIGAPREVVVGEPVEDAWHQIVDAVEGVDQQVTHVHDHTLAPGADRPVMLRP